MTQQNPFNFNSTYTNLPHTFYTTQQPEKSPNPSHVIINKKLATTLGINLDDITQAEQDQLFSGNDIPQETQPFAQAYSGHQFGHFTQLGDGRALMLGEHQTPDKKQIDIQFKGSGKTPYSRRGDGKATLDTMLREYIISEAMHALNIPTTRSLAVVKTGETIQRQTRLPGAILTRTASSHIRVGTFEYAATQQDTAILTALLQYTINRHYPHLNDNENPAQALLKMVIDKQTDLIIHWMRVGFIHGVMNTDNMTLSGETIDYGPCAFMNTYDPKTVFSSIDVMGRYAYQNQSKIAQWNITRLAETLIPLLHQNTDNAVEIANGILTTYQTIYQTKWCHMMSSKLGMLDTQEKDDQLITDILNWMQTNQADYTNTFKELTYKPSTYQHAPWYNQWNTRIQHTKDQSKTIMQQVNPVIIPRNHQVEHVLQSALNNNLKPFNDLLNALQTPYAYNPDNTHYHQPPDPSDTPYQTYCGT